MRCMAVLLRAGKKFTASEIAGRFEVDPKTIRRDLDFMRDRLGWSVEYDHTRATWDLVAAPEAAL